MSTVEMEYKGDVVLVNPITSIRSNNHLKILSIEYQLSKQKRYDFFTDKDTDAEKDVKREQQKNHDLYLLRFEAAFVKGVRKDKFTKANRKKTCRYEMQKRSRKINRGTKGRTSRNPR